MASDQQLCAAKVRHAEESPGDTAISPARECRVAGNPLGIRSCRTWALESIL
jgi:hypothetical protein